MKITIITGPFSCLPPDSIGAVEKLWCSLGMEWIKEGHEVNFVCKLPTADRKEAHRICIKGYERTGSWFKDLVLDFVYSWKALKKIPSTDVLILNSLWTPILVRIAKKRYKIVLYSVERFPKHQIDTYRKFGKIDCFRCCSTAVYDALAEQSPKSKEYACIIPNFIDTGVFYAKSTKQLSKTPTIVYAGRVHAEKGLDILMKAVEWLYEKEHIQLHLLIIGARDKERGGSGEDYAQRLESMAPNCKIEWVDAIYQPEKLAAEIRRGDIFCYPSVAEHGESFGVTPLEAMGLGIPVIVSSLACFKDFVQDGENALVFDYKAMNTEEQLANQIYQLLVSPELFEKCSVAGMKTAQNFTVEAIAKQYFNKFEELLYGKTIS